jgi:hypothetical protein
MTLLTINGQIKKKLMYLVIAVWEFYVILHISIVFIS